LRPSLVGAKSLVVAMTTPSNVKIYWAEIITTAENR
jgi:hypothetical protein